MTINISDLNIPILKYVVENFDSLTELEADLIVQLGIHRLSGLRKKEEVFEVFERIAKKMDEKNVWGKEIDQYKIMKYIINK